MRHLSCILLCVVLSGNIYGQSFDHTKEFHELRLGMGYLPLATTIDFWTIHDNASFYPGTEATSYLGKKTYTPAFSLAYSYRLKRWLSLGLGFTYACSYQNTYDLFTDRKMIRDYKYYVSITPTVRFHWVRAKYVNLYSSLGLGIGYYVTTEKNRGNKTRSVEPGPSLDFNFIGIAVGHKLFGYTELAASSEGIIRFGIGYRFNN